MDLLGVSSTFLKLPHSEILETGTTLVNSRNVIILGVIGENLSNSIVNEVTKIERDQFTIKGKQMAMKDYLCQYNYSVVLKILEPRKIEVSGDGILKFQNLIPPFVIEGGKFLAA